ncbi:MAG: flavodoxin, partial [Methanobrevibacter sp.]|nr:flavodoxin [Methanobrevibacter sp.]
MSDIIIYFSRTGENYFGGELKNIEKGNTEVIADYIQEFTGAELFKVEPLNDYPDDYMECIDIA